MRNIKDMTERIKEEFKDAKYYATKAIECKENDNLQDAKLYYEMANQELQHGMNLHGMAVREVSALKEKMSTPPPFMEEMWEHEHEYYVEEVGKIKYMLAEFLK